MMFQFCLTVEMMFQNLFKAYMSSPCHVEVILSEKEDIVSKPTDEDAAAKKKKKESKKKQKRQLARGDYQV